MRRNKNAVLYLNTTLYYYFKENPKCVWRQNFRRTFIFVNIRLEEQDAAMLGLIVNLLSMTIPAVITIHVFRSAERALATFNFHPVYMSIGYIFLATQAMLFLYFNTDNVIKFTTEETDRKSKVRIHTWINLTSTLLIALGFAGEYLHFGYIRKFCWIYFIYFWNIEFSIFWFCFSTLFLAILYHKLALDKLHFATYHR